MSLDKIIWAIAAIVAILFAFVSFEMAGLILAIVGLVSGYFIKGDHRRGVILAAVFLMAGGASGLGAIPTAGEYLTAIFTSYGAVLSAASLMVIVMATAERLIPGMAASE